MVQLKRDRQSAVQWRIFCCYLYCFTDSPQYVIHQITAHLLALLCLLYSIQRIKTAGAVRCFTLCCLLLLTSHISAENNIRRKPPGNSHLSSKFIHRCFDFLNISNVHLFIYKSAVTKPIFFDFHQALIVSEYALISCEILYVNIAMPCRSHSPGK